MASPYSVLSRGDSINRSSGFGSGVSSSTRSDGTPGGLFPKRKQALLKTKLRSVTGEVTRDAKEAAKQQAEDERRAEQKRIESELKKKQMLLPKRAQTSQGLRPIPPAVDFGKFSVPHSPVLWDLNQFTRPTTSPAVSYSTDEVMRVKSSTLAGRNPSASRAGVSFGRGGRPPLPKQHTSKLLTLDDDDADDRDIELMGRGNGGAKSKGSKSEDEDEHSEEEFMADDRFFSTGFARMRCRRCKKEFYGSRTAHSYCCSRRCYLKLEKEERDRELTNRCVSCNKKLTVGDALMQSGNAYCGFFCLRMSRTGSSANA